MNQNIEIIYDEIEQNKEYEDLIKKVLDKCYEIEEIEGYICITLTNNENIKEINKQYRNIDKATDVLSFPMYEKEEIEQIRKEGLSDVIEQITIGDIIISIPKVIEQAKEYEHSFERELAYMLVHGFCHLMGFDHIEENDKQEMRKEEEKILEALKISR